MRRPVCAKAAATLTAVVVLPTPPFWFMIAIERMSSHPRRGSILAENGDWLRGAAGPCVRRDVAATVPVPFFDGIGRKIASAFGKGYYIAACVAEKGAR